MGAVEADVAPHPAGSSADQHEPEPTGAASEASLPRVETLYREHFPAAVRLAYLLTSDRSVAEDIAQEAFLAAAPRLFGLSSPEAFAAYLRRTVVRRVLMRARSAAREERRWRQAVLQRVEPPVDQTAGAAIRLDLVAALKELPVRQRTAVVLRYWADLGEEDIAVLLRCRRGTVKSTLSRALDALRKDVLNDGRS